MSSGDEIRAAIVAAGGRLPFREFMRLALYGEHGFYTSTGPTAAGGRAGRRGDFLTAPEVGPLFGAVLARFLDAEWRRLGHVAPFTVVDAGAGPGTLARAVLAAEPDCRSALEYVAVEVSASQRELHPAAVTSRPDVPSGPLDGVVVANELLDNLPFGLAVYDAGWREAHVVDDGHGGFAEVLGPALDPLPIGFPARAGHGTRLPVLDEAAAWLRDAAGRLRAGTVVVIDYARPTAELASLPWREWLRTYRQHAPGGHYLAAPGTQDITADVAIDQLPPPDTVCSLAQFLERWGIDALVAEGRRSWSAAADRPGLQALAGRSRTREAEALLDPNGLGRFTVAEWRVR